jgi:hypothetical protein
MPSNILTGLSVQGQLTAQQFTPPPSCIGDNAVQTPSSGGLAIQAQKVIHLLTRQLATTPGSAVTSQTQLVHIVNGSSCQVVGVNAVALVASTGSDSVTIDVKNSPNASTTFTSVLSAPIVLNNSVAAGTVISGTVATTNVNANSKFEISIVASGTSTQGLLVDLVLYESAF